MNANSASSAMIGLCREKFKFCFNSGSRGVWFALPRAAAPSERRDRSHAARSEGRVASTADAVDAAPRSRDADKNLMSSDIDICATKIGINPSKTPWKGGTTISKSVDQIRTRGGFSNIVVNRTEVHRMTLIRMVRKPAMKKIIKKTFSSKANQTMSSM